MPWIQRTPMEQRKRMIEALLDGHMGVTQASRIWGVSRKTVYKWLKRFQAEGIAGLADRSHAAHTCPHRTPDEVAEAIEDVRRAHPWWGPRKVLAFMRRHGIYADRLPAASTAGDILKRAGLVPKRRRRRRPAQGPRPGVAAQHPNHVWCADFKGEFRTRDGRLCYPLTIMDQYSRYLLACEALSSTKHEPTRAVFERLFREHGMPCVIRTDNGCPFGSASMFGLSRLTLWWMKLGILHDPIEPGKPQQNGSHERMHRTLKTETARPPASNASEQQARFDAFRWEYNHERPHEAIGMRTPADIWTPSPRGMPSGPVRPQYEGHMVIRRVRHCGEIKFKGRLLFLSEVLAGELVALEEVEDGIWRILLYGTELARLDERSWKLIPLSRINHLEP